MVMKLFSSSLLPVLCPVFLFDSLQVADMYRPLPSPVVQRKLRIQNSWPGVSGMRAWGVVVLRHHLFTPNKKRELKILM